MTNTNMKIIKRNLLLVMAIAFVMLFSFSAAAEEVKNSYLASSGFDYSDIYDGEDDEDDEEDDEEDEDSWEDYFWDDEEDDYDDEFTYYDKKTGLVYWYPGDDSYEVQVEGRLEKDKKPNIVIPDQVTISGKKFSVTAIGEDAFSDDMNLKKVTISKNIVIIRKYAFKNCKNLQRVEIKSKKLRSIGKDAFKNLHKKVKIKVPKEKLKSYNKLFRGKMSKGVKLS